MASYGKTKPQSMPEPAQARRWLLPGMLTLLFIAVVAVLTLPVLSLPPRDHPVGGSFDSDGTSTDLDPSRSHLAETRDRRIAVYVPEQAFPQGGRLIIQPRRPELIPERVSLEAERLLAVDLLVIDASGAVVPDVEFNAVPLLCFRPLNNQMALAEAGQAAIRVQRYDESRVPGVWVDMNPVLGWEQGQICAGLDHLSLFALVSGPSISEQAAYGDHEPPTGSESGVPRLYVPMGGP